MESEIFNATGYPMKIKENGKPLISGVKEGDQLNVSTDMGSERMIVAYIQDGYIYCDCDGIERTVALRLRSDNTLLFVDITN